jgi:hypothetical protein
VAQWDQVAEANQQNESHQELRQELDQELHPQRPCALQLFGCLNVITTIVTIGMALGQFLGLVFDPHQDILELVLRIYVLAFCTLIICNEFQISTWTRDATLLRFWVTRGILYAFVGMLGLMENDISNIRNNGSTVANAASTLYLAIVAWALIVCGCFYTLLGLCCAQLAYDRMKTKYQERLDRAKATERTTMLYGNVMGGTTGAATTT